MITISEQRLHNNRAVLPHVYPSGVTTHGGQRSFLGNVRHAAVLPVMDNPTHVRPEITMSFRADLKDPQSANAVTISSLRVSPFLPYRGVLEEGEDEDEAEERSDPLLASEVVANVQADLADARVKLPYVRRWPTFAVSTDGKRFVLGIPGNCSFSMAYELAVKLGLQGQGDTITEPGSVVFSNTKQDPFIFLQSSEFSGLNYRPGRDAFECSLMFWFPNRKTLYMDEMVDATSSAHLASVVQGLLDRLTDSMNLKNVVLVRGGGDRRDDAVTFLSNQHLFGDYSTDHGVELVLGADMRQHLLCRRESLLLPINRPFVQVLPLLKTTTDLTEGQRVYIYSNIGSLPAIVEPKLGRQTLLAVKQAGGRVDYGDFVQSVEMPLLSVEIYDVNNDPIVFPYNQVKLRLEVYFESIV